MSQPAACLPTLRAIAEIIGQVHDPLGKSSDLELTFSAADKLRCLTADLERYGANDGLIENVRNLANALDKLDETTDFVLARVEDAAQAAFDAARRAGGAP